MVCPNVLCKIGKTDIGGEYKQYSITNETGRRLCFLGYYQ